MNNTAFTDKLNQNKVAIVNHLIKYHKAVYISPMNGSNPFLERAKNGWAHLQTWNGEKPDFTKSGEVNNTETNKYFYVSFYTYNKPTSDVEDIKAGLTDLCFEIRKEVLDLDCESRRFLVVTKSYIFDCDQDYAKKHIVETFARSNGSVCYVVRMNKSNLKPMDKETEPAIDLSKIQFQYIQNSCYSQYRFRGQLFQYKVKQNEQTVTIGFAKSVGQLLDVLGCEDITKNKLYYLLRKGVATFNLPNGRIVEIVKGNKGEMTFDTDPSVSDHPIGEVFVATDSKEDPSLEEDFATDDSFVTGDLAWLLQCKKLEKPVETVVKVSQNTGVDIWSL